MKQLEVTIMGQSYILGCPEGGEQSLLSAVAAVDKEMSAIRDAGKVKARERIAVLAALNLAYLLAERPAAAAAPAAVAARSQGSMSTGDVDVEALIRRIDQLLGEEGQLL
jgi:cell division protein ZapA